MKQENRDGFAHSPDPGRSMAWRLLPAAIILPLLLGWIRLLGERHGLYGTGFGVLLFAGANVLMFTALICWTAHSLRRADAGRLEAMRELHDREERLRRAVEATGLGTWDWYPVEGRLIWSQRCRELFGVSLTEDVSFELFLSRLHPDDRTRTKEVVASATDPNGTGEYQIEYRSVWSDGTVHWIDARGHASFGEVAGERKAVRFTGTVLDITERKQAEERIRQLNADLEYRVQERTADLQKAVKELEAFSYSVSHDLRAPLRAISGYSRILLEDHDDRLDEEGRRVLGVICSEVRRMGQLIDELLAFSQLGRQKMELTEIDMAGLARSVFEGLARLEEGRRIELKIGELPPARGEETMIRQVWANLFANAIKFTATRDTAEIEVGCRNGSSEQTYYVKDNGVGFDMAHARKLFGVFQRLHAEDEFEGTGVGLAIVQRAIQRHGGRVFAEGNINAGATFYFALPNPKS